MERIIPDNGGYVYKNQHYYLVNGTFYYYGPLGSELKRCRNQIVLDVLRQYTGITQNTKKQTLKQPQTRNLEKILC